METRIDKEDKVVTYINCITGRTEKLIFKNGTLMGITEIESSEKNISFIGTGLIYTCFTGMPPGEYQNHIGGTVILDNEKRVSLKSNPGLLAGAAKSLLENVEYLINSNLSTLNKSWQMASENVATMLMKNDDTFDNKNDKVIFKVFRNEIQVESVMKNGRIFFLK